MQTAPPVKSRACRVRMQGATPSVAFAQIDAVRDYVMLDGIVFTPERSALGDLPDWRALALEVAPLFGEPMAGEPAWEEHLVTHIQRGTAWLSLIHISEPTRLLSISYAVFCLKKK